MGFLISMQMAIKNCKLVLKKHTCVQGQCLKNSPYAPIFYWVSQKEDQSLLTTYLCTLQIICIGIYVRTFSKTH